MKALRIAAGVLAFLMGLVTVASWFAAIWVPSGTVDDQLFATGFLSLMIGIGAAAAASID